MMKKVAIPISNNQLSEFFGECSFYQIYHIDGNKIQKITKITPQVSDITMLPEWTANQGISDIITYKVSHEIINLFSQHKINLYVGIELDQPEKLMELYLNEELVSNDAIIKEIFNH